MGKIGWAAASSQRACSRKASLIGGILLRSKM